MTDRNTLRIAFIGFGEVGRTVTGDLRGTPGVEISAFDLKFNDPAQADALRAGAVALGVKPGSSATGACAGAHVIISAVTASESEKVAQKVATFIKPGQVYIDLNSASPNAKIRSSKVIDATGANYVEWAVMAPIIGPGMKVPVLAGGALAEETTKRMNAIGFNGEAVSPEVGRASHMKLCRSIIIKGLEVLMVDCATAAAKAGVTKEVYASLTETFPSLDFYKLADFMGERVGTHGVRRASEMYETAEMLNDLGMNPELMRAVADAQLRGVKPKG